MIPNSTMVFHGGVSYDPQTRALRNGLDVLAWTPLLFNCNIDLSEDDTKRRHGRGPTDGGGGEDEHERGIEMTKNKVEIHLFYFNISIM